MVATSLAAVAIGSEHTEHTQTIGDTGCARVTIIIRTLHCLNGVDPVRLLKYPFQVERGWSV